jgi:probable HAF family extracellular repeat protein
MTTGVATAADGSQHAVYWLFGQMTDIAKPGLGGLNSSAGAVNEFGLVMGGAETTSKDPNNENFCGYGSGLQCLVFTWQWGDGGMRALPTLGGTNATWGAINNLGEISGIAETNHKDSNCPASVAVDGTGPVQFDFEPVIWGPKVGSIRQLPLLSGDTVGFAMGINDHGQAVGASGACANTVLPGFAAAPHAVLWESDGTPVNLGNLGGTVNTSILAVGNFAAAINNRGMVVGQSTLEGNTTFHPFLWTRQTGILDLGVLSGDLVGIATDVNNQGVIVGASVSAPGPSSGNARAYIWEQGKMTDLNELAANGNSLYLLTAFSINDAGVIAGFGVTDDGELHGFLATPSGGDPVNPQARVAKTPPMLTDEAHKFLLQHGFRGK